MTGSVGLDLVPQLADEDVDGAVPPDQPSGPHRRRFRQEAAGQDRRSKAASYVHPDSLRRRVQARARAQVAPGRHRSLTTWEPTVASTGARLGHQRSGDDASTRPRSSSLEPARPTIGGPVSVLCGQLFTTNFPVIYESATLFALALSRRVKGHARGTCDGGDSISEQEFGAAVESRALVARLQRSRSRPCRRSGRAAPRAGDVLCDLRGESRRILHGEIG